MALRRRLRARSGNANMQGTIVNVMTTKPWDGPLSGFRFFASGSRPPGPNQSPDEFEDVEVEDAPQSAVPRRYKVVFHNDDYTTQEFVIFVLEQFFYKSPTEALHIMLTVHHKGSAVAGVYTKDVAETKVEQVMDAARDNGMPLLLTTEPE